MVAIFVLAASALLAVPAVVAAPETTPNHLWARQLTGFDPSKIPSSCLTTQCQNFVNQISNQNCVTLQCLCTTDVVNAIKSCEQCAIDAGGVTQADIDSAMTAFAQGCSSAGFPISGVSTSGGSSSASAGSGSGSGSSATAAGTKTASGSASTATTAGTSSGSTTGSTKSGATTLTAGLFGSFAAVVLGVLSL